MGAIKVGEAFVDLTMPVGSLIKDAAQAESAFKAFSVVAIAQTGLIAKALAGIGAAMTAFITAPMVFAVATTTEFASAANEAANLFDVAFGKAGESVTKWSEKLGSALGLSAFEFRQSAAQMQLFLTSMGVADDRAVSMSKAIAGLSVDVASMRDLEPEEAFNKMQSALAGITKPLKDIGISLSVATISQTALDLGIKQTVGSMNEQQKIMLRYITLLRATNKDQGDFARTMGGYANLARRSGSETRDLARAIGKILAPALAAVKFTWLGVKSVMTSVITLFGKLPQPILFMVGSVLLLVAALGPLLVVSASLVVVYFKIKFVIWGAKLALASYNTIAATSIGMQLGLANASAIAAKAMAGLAAVINFARASWVGLMITLGAVGAALVALGFLFQWLLGISKDAGGKIKEDMEAMAEEIGKATSNLKALIGQFRIMGSLDIAAFRKAQVAAAAAPQRGFIGGQRFFMEPQGESGPLGNIPPAPVGPSIRSTSAGTIGGMGGTGGKFDTLIQEVRGLRDDITTNMGLA